MFLVVMFLIEINFYFVRCLIMTDAKAPLRQALNGYEASRILHPMVAKNMTEDHIKKQIDVLKDTFPFVLDEMVVGLKSEISSYLIEAKATKNLPPVDKNDPHAPKVKRSDSRAGGAEGHRQRMSFSSEGYQVLKWWASKHFTLMEAATAAEKLIQRRCVTLPYFGLLFDMMSLIQPSSAAAERVFSLLNNMFDRDRLNCLRDLIEGSLLLRVNQEND